MISKFGTLENDYIKLDKDYYTKNSVKLIVTFLEIIQSNSEKTINLEDFSFAKSQKNLQSFKGSFTEKLIDERREAQ